jgi:hypothetical protein
MLGIIAEYYPITTDKLQKGSDFIFYPLHNGFFDLIYIGKSLATIKISDISEFSNMLRRIADYLKDKPSLGYFNIDLLVIEEKKTKQNISIDIIKGVSRKG